MFARHDLVWLSARGWRRARAAAPAHLRDAVDGWMRQDWPAIVRRADAGVPEDRLAVGIALPPASDGAKGRIACSVAIEDVESHVPPLRLAQVLAMAPHPWRRTLGALERQAAMQGLVVRVFGSVAMQTLTARPYLTAASDIDLLLHPASPAQLRRALDLLASYAGMLPLDGEVVFPSGRAVAWKELAMARDDPSRTRVLAKDIGGVSLQPACALFAPHEGTVPVGLSPAFPSDAAQQKLGTVPKGQSPFPRHA
ncbi:MAG TPA: malonate decarboxylase holo-[acyl-carrier-protein] synthase [Telluria sp.]|nr:malonate decarboxylase holo-[acyl-carrier-protein] synthase [Telluria sp.]